MFRLHRGAFIDLAKRMRARPLDLEESVLDRNTVSEIGPGDLELFANLQYLYPARDELTVLSGLQHSIRLKVIDARCNRIGDVDISHQLCLNELCLAGNRLQGLDAFVTRLAHMRYLHVLDLRDNDLALESGYRRTVIRAIQPLQLLDGLPITACERRKRTAQRAPAMPVGFLDMPTDLVLVRHGDAEGNKVFTEGQKGNNEFFTPPFMKTHESKWRLTPEGRQQVIETGAWIRACVAEHFGRYLTSGFARALETAALLQLPHANWERDVFLRERNFERLASLRYAERAARFHRELGMRRRDVLYWTPPSGESLADLALRCDYILDSLAEFPIPPTSATRVTRFNAMQTFRTRIEMIRQANFEREVAHAGQPHRVRNGPVIHYTRRGPQIGAVAPVYTWKRFATPWMGGRWADAEWEEILDGSLGNEDLARDIDRPARDCKPDDTRAVMVN